MEQESRVQGFKPLPSNKVIGTVLVPRYSFSQIVSEMSPERIDMLITEISEIRDRMSEHAKSLQETSEANAAFKGQVKGMISIIQWLAGAAVGVGMLIAGAITSALFTLNDLKSQMSQMPTALELQLMKNDLADVKARVNNLEQKPAQPAQPPVNGRGRH